MKKIWLVFQSALLSLAVISWLAGAENLFGICLTLLIVFSFPLNLLVGWLFFAFDALQSVPAMALVMAFVMSAIGYVQWFNLVPGIARFFSRELSAHDRQIKISVERPQAPQLEDRKETDGFDWLRMSKDNDKYSPVERVLDQE